jgi:hypothetical protein
MQVLNTQNACVSLLRHARILCIENLHMLRRTTAEVHATEHTQS